MSRNTTTSFDDLPGETAASILLRLPVKALIRSTSVNKTWYSLITNPNFISAQIKRSISHSNDNDVLIISQSEKRCSLISAETSKVIEKYEIPFTTKTESFRLIASVNGLLLLSDSHLYHCGRNLYLWNPCVKTHKILVSSCFKNLLDNLHKSYVVVGMGFSQASNDYKVVRIVYIWGNQSGNVPSKVEVYSLRKQTWKKMKDPAVHRLSSTNGVYVNGSFYWIEMKSTAAHEEGSVYDSKDLWMLTFDFDNEVFGELKFPEKVSNCLGTGVNFRLMEFDGSLALCVFDVKLIDKVITFRYRIWLMRQENGVVSWTLRFKGKLKEGGWPLNITKRGTILIERHPFPGIISCNLETMHYKDLGFGQRGIVKDPLLIPEPWTIDSSFPESLVMYEGGRSLLKFAK